MVLFLVLYPILGFIGGIIGAAFYNLAAKVAGGLELSFDSLEQ